MPEEKATDENALDAGTSAVADPVAQLQNELTQAQSEAEGWRDRFLRKAAEFENFRKRTEKEKIEFLHLAKSSVLLELLPLMDAYDRALEHFDDAQIDHQGLEQYKEGVQLLYKQFRDVMTRLGVVAIEVRGKAFDPHIHEALTFEETTEFEDHTVIDELRRGYFYKDRLLRPAQVRVATRPKGAIPGKS
jgi:molecular chaperone GrpE